MSKSSSKNISDKYVKLDPIEHVLGTDGLSQNDITLITGGNACKLFNIK